MSDDKVLPFERRKINEWPKVVYLADFGDGDGCRPHAYIQHPDDTTPHYVRGDLHDALSAHADDLEAKLAKAVEALKAVNKDLEMRADMKGSESVELGASAWHKLCITLAELKGTDT